MVSQVLISITIYIRDCFMPCTQEIKKTIGIMSLHNIKDSYMEHSCLNQTALDTHTSWHEQPPEAMVTCRPSCWYLRVTLAGWGEEALRIGNDIQQVLTPKASTSIIRVSIPSHQRFSCWLKHCTGMPTAKQPGDAVVELEKCAEVTGFLGGTRFNQ